MKTLFAAEYQNKSIQIDEKFLIVGKERELLGKLKKFNLGSGHEELELLKLNDDNFVFCLETYVGGPVQTVYFQRIK